MFRSTAGMLIATAAAIAVPACYSSNSKYQLAPLPAAQQLVDTIIDGSFVVAPRTFKPFEIMVGPGMRNPRLEGTFTASGANNDIEVLLLDEQQYSNWQNRHGFKPAYQSGRVTADKLRIELPTDPGKYFMVFSNRFSMLSNKGVVADLKLRYDRESPR